MKVPKEKEEELKNGDLKANEVYKYFFKGFFSEEEKHRFVIKIWTEVKKKIEERDVSLIHFYNGVINNGS